MLSTAPIISATEKLYTLVKRAQVSTHRDDHRDAIIETFKALCTDLGKLAVEFRRPDWMRAHIAIVDLHSAAISDEEARCGTFTLIGAELALVTSLHSLAANLGFLLEDAATAPVHADDDAARAAVEGVDGHEMREAAE